MKLFLLFFICIFKLNYSIKDSLNFILSPLGKECFFEDIEAGLGARSIEIFVPSGSNLNIQLEILGPLTLSQIRSETFPAPIVTESVNILKQEDSESQSFIQEFEPDNPGTYAFCVDNRNSRFMPRKVQIDIKVIPDSYSDKNSTEVSSEAILNENESVNERLKESIKKIHDGLHFIQHQQKIDRNRLNLYSLTNLSSHNNMIIGSIVETFVFIVACIFQIFFVRRWFLAKGGSSSGKDKRIKDAATEWA